MSPGSLLPLCTWGYATIRRIDALHISSAKICSKEELGDPDDNTISVVFCANIVVDKH